MSPKELKDMTDTEMDEMARKIVDVVTAPEYAWAREHVKVMRESDTQRRMEEARTREMKERMARARKYRANGRR